MYKIQEDKIAKEITKILNSRAKYNEHGKAKPRVICGVDVPTIEEDITKYIVKLLRSADVIVKE